MVESLYPPIHNGCYPSTSSAERAYEFFFAAAQQTLLQETTCSGTAVDTYEVAIHPTIHGSDIPHTFYNGPTPNVDASVATIIQHSIAGFYRAIEHRTVAPLWEQRDNLEAKCQLVSCIFRHNMEQQNDILGRNSVISIRFRGRGGSGIPLFFVTRLSIFSRGQICIWIRFFISQS